jgi:polysaccharide biosynthesis protein PslG
MQTPFLRRAYRMLAAVFLCCIFTAAIASDNPAIAFSASGYSRALIGKKVSFAVLDDYDKGDDLADVANDFQLMKELGIYTMRTSFGWDDYEPERGKYDFDWLQRFVALAAQNGIQLRPYIGYTPKWAGKPGKDNEDWNNPPADYRAWHDFVYQLVSALKPYGNVVSYEIYNEENAPLWWDGSIDEYKETLRTGALAVKAADPKAQVLIGGFVFPDINWLYAITKAGYAKYFDIAAFHAYPETWTEPGVVVENYLDAKYRDYFVPYDKKLGEGEPIWINEMGFATSPGKSEREQAAWWARAVSTFLADPEIEHIGVYEIKDRLAETKVIGDAPNYYLGLTYTDRRKKLAFSTVKMLSSLLNTGTLTVADAGAKIVVGGAPGKLYHHVFKRPDGKQVVFVYDREASPTVKITLPFKGKTAYRYDLAGNALAYDDFDGQTLQDVRLTAGDVAIFRIDP